jgi:hypothetical protein
MASDDTTSPVAAEGLRERLIETLNTTLVKLDGGIKTATDMPWDRHDKHRFLYNCAVCQGNIPAIVTAVLAALAGDSGEDLRAVMAADLRQAIDYELTTGGAEGLAELLASLEDPATSALVTDALGVRDEHLAHMTARALYAEGQLSARDDHETRWEAEHAKVERLQAELAEMRRTSHQEIERQMLALIDERDGLEERLDKFAVAVAPIGVIGEHSSSNDPWANALGLVTPAAEVDRLRAERDALKAAIERAREMHRRSCLVATNPYPEGTLDGVTCHMCAALDAPETPEDAPAKPRHIGDRANAEDCPACTGDLPYPWICPGEPETPGDAPIEPRRDEYGHTPDCPSGSQFLGEDPACRCSQTLAAQTPGDAETEDSDG